MEGALNLSSDRLLDDDDDDDDGPLYLNLHDDLFTCCAEAAAVRLGRVKNEPGATELKHVLMSRTYITRKETRHCDSFVLFDVCRTQYGCK